MPEWPHILYVDASPQILKVDASRPAALRKLEISIYSYVFVPCQPGGATPKIVNLFFREP
jgi:hypothetical protein